MNALRDSEIRRARVTYLSRLQALFDGRPADEQVFCLAGLASTSLDPDWEGWLPRGLAELAERPPMARNPHVFRPLIFCYNPYGVHFTDSIFGADVFLLSKGNWQTRPLDIPVGELPAPDIDNHPTWVAARAFARRFLELDLDTVTLVLPTIASALNVAVNLFGQRIIAAMLLDPGAARRDLGIINDVLCEMHRWYIAHIPFDKMQCIAAAGRFQPHGHGQLCGCTSQLLSAGQYEDFIAPLDDELLRPYPHGGLIHLCGAHTQHIPAWRGMASLQAIQMNDRAAEDVEAYFGGLREDQILYVHPFDRVPLGRVLEITGGRRLVLCACPESPIRRR